MFEIVVIIFCLIANALLAGYEIGFVSAPKPQLRHLAKNGRKDADRVLRLRENPERTLSIIQVGITLVGALASAIGGAGATETLTPYLQERFELGETSAEIISITMVVIPITYMSVVFGELVPKTLSLRNPLRISLAGARWLILADKIFSPIVTILEWSTKQIVRIFFKKSRVVATPADTVVEIDGLEPHHKQAVLNFVHLERRKVNDLLVPWENVTVVRSSDSVDDIVSIVFASGHTRIPVVENGKMLGILHTKEFLANRESKGGDWHKLIRPAVQTVSTNPALSTLRHLQVKCSHMAVVYSPEGRLIGIISMEDILEDFLGEVFDEDDESYTRRIFADRVKGKMRPPIV